MLQWENKIIGCRAHRLRDVLRRTTPVVGIVVPRTSAPDDRSDLVVHRCPRGTNRSSAQFANRVRQAFRGDASLFEQVQVLGD